MNISHSHHIKMRRITAKSNQEQPRTAFKVMCLSYLFTVFNMLTIANGALFYSNSPSSFKPQFASSLCWDNQCVIYPGVNGMSSSHAIQQSAKVPWVAGQCWGSWRCLRIHYLQYQRSKESSVVLQHINDFIEEFLCFLRNLKKLADTSRH